MSELTSIDGASLRGAFEAGTRCLERYRDAINALNVFPVPDGDTGTNMLLTMRSSNEATQKFPSSSAGTTVGAMAHGALLGARGNSGVILSQFFQGMAKGLSGKDQLDGPDLATAFQSASTAAYRAVGKPVDGTMLTVIHKLSEAAQGQVAGDHGDVLTVWGTGVEAAKIALSQTPLQLPVLREAGVVDAGGQGIVTILEGAYCFLAGHNVDDMEFELCVPCDTDSVDTAQLVTMPVVQEEYLAATEEDLYGYCTQLLIHGEGFDIDEIRQKLATMAGSTVVVGEENLVKVHVHAYDPGPVVSYAVSLGTLEQVSIDNMDEQHEEFVDFHRRKSEASTTEPEDQAVRKTAVVAVAWGEGFERLFGELGCDTLVQGGQTMNPSTQDLLDAAKSVEATDVILLPNNRNIVPAAQQAVSLAGGDTGEGRALTLHVVPSRTIPQGVAALLAFNPEVDLAANLEAMNRALDTVKTIEVTRAVKDANVDGLSVKEGQYIGLLDGRMVEAGKSADSVLDQTVRRLGPSGVELVTLYWGEDIDQGQAKEAAERLQTGLSGVEVETVYGGQPHYHYMVSVE